MSPRFDAMLGWVIALVVVLQATVEWTGAAWAQVTVVVLLVIMLAMLAPVTNLTGRILLTVATVLTVILVSSRADWSAAVWRGLVGMGFFTSYFCALAILRKAAQTSPAMMRAGTYLARQPPGRRYLALTFGAHVFALMLNYGVIQLLGTLVISSAKSEPDETIRKIRIRRMLLAIQRGFIAALPWSPLSFAVVISVATFPGTSWSSVAMPGLVAAGIILLSGWALDTILKPPPRPGGQPAPQLPPGRWSALLPLALLLGLIVCSVLVFELTLGLRVVSIVLVVVPLISLIWIRLQSGNARALGRQVSHFVTVEIPSYRNEILLIATANYIGTVGSTLVGPYMASSGFDLTVLPVWLLLLGLVLVMPTLGQLGANPILSMSLIAPLLPPAEAIGLPASGAAVALVSGWAMTGITSPFTATNLLLGRFAGIRAIDVGWVWNRAYFPITVALLYVWVLIYNLVLH